MAAHNVEIPPSGSKAADFIIHNAWFTIAARLSMIGMGLAGPIAGYAAIEVWSFVRNSFMEIKQDVKDRGADTSVKFDKVSGEIREMNNQLFAIRLLQQAIEAQTKRIDKQDIDIDELKKRVWSTPAPSNHIIYQDVPTRAPSPEQGARQKWEQPR